ncbi:MAG: carboxypeptidase-like regulatory domain-containing protein [Planctomycetota bacterium]|jgi:hypothetical protein
MSGSRSATALVVLLLAVSAGIVVFVIRALDDPKTPDPRQSRSAAAVARPPARPAAEEPGAVSPRIPAGPTPANDEDSAAEEPAAGPEAHAKKDEDPPVKESPYELAELTIELLVPQEVPDRMILAVVRDAAGQVIEDALVTFRSGPRLVYRERTDLAGEARFYPLEFEVGPFRVDAVAEGFTTDTAQAVKPGAETELILEALPAIGGVVIAEAKGTGIVKLFMREGVVTTPVANDGSFLFEDLEEGFYTVQAEVPPYGIASKTFFLPGGEQRNVRLRISKSSHMRIHGTITGWQRGGVAKINGIQVPVTASGSFEFDKAVIGVNEIFFDVPEKALQRERFSISGRKRSRYDFKVTRAGRIRGRVRDAETRRAVPGAQVRLGVEFGDPRNNRVPLFPIHAVPVVQADSDGRFVIERLDKRLVYILSVVHGGYGQALIEGVVPASSRVVDLPHGPFLFGKLRGYGGIPRGAKITAERLEETPNGRLFNVANYDVASSERDRKGYYGLSGLIPGTYLVRVTAERYGSIETVVDLSEGRRARVDLRMRQFDDPDERDAHLLRRLPAVLDDDLDPEDLPPALTTSLAIDVRRGENEDPFPGVRVSFWEDDEEFGPRLEFTEQRFEIVGLPEGEYRAVLTHPALKKPLVADKVVVRRGRENVLELR